MPTEQETTSALEAARLAGRTEGEILARLADHDNHFRVINGSIASVADKLATMVLSIQSLSDGMQSDRLLAVRTAEALEQARRDRVHAIEDRDRPRSMRHSYIMAASVVTSTIIAAITLLLAVHVIG